MAEEFFRTILKSQDFEATEDLSWESLDAAERRNIVENIAYDVDFCLVYGPCTTIMTDRTVAAIFSNLSGSFLRKPFIQNLSGSPIGRILVIVDAKPFRIGLSIGKKEGTEDDEELFSPFENQLDENPENVSGFIQEVVRRLQNHLGNSFPFRDVQKILLDQLGQFDLAFFQFGQKQPLPLFIEQFQYLNPSLKLCVALGMETYLGNFVLCCEPFGISVGESFFPLFLSQKAGSILLTEKNANKALPGSFRLVCYNTSHHRRKFFPFELDLKSGLEELNDFFDCDGQAGTPVGKFIELLRMKIFQNITMIASNVHQLVGNSKIRLERYFLLEIDHISKK